MTGIVLTSVGVLRLRRILADLLYRFAGGALLAVDAVDIHEAGGLLEAAVGRQHHPVALNLGHLDVSLPNGIELKIKTT